MFETAYAQAAGTAGGGDIFASLFPLILIFAIFYFLIIRPQNKRRKEHENKVNAIAKGDEILTSGGMFGTVTAVEETTVNVEIAKGVTVKLLKHMVMDVTPKAETKKPAAKKTAAKKTAKKK